LASVRFENISKSYGDVVAVKDLHLTCADGEMLALLGPSGCGKSTTLKMVAGIEHPSEGSISFDDREVTDLAPGARNIAMVFEDYALYPHLTAEDNIAFPLKVRGIDGKTIRERVGAIIDLLGLDALRQSRVAKLSGGAQQRIAIGRALVRDPDLILFDEPLSHLDADQKVQLRTEIKRLQQTEGVTSILVTHDQTEAIAMCDRIAVMNHGVLQQVAPPQELYDQPANTFVANFIGEPPMNQIEMELRSQGEAIYLETADLSLEINESFASKLRDIGTDRRLIMGIRPEHLVVEPLEPGDLSSGPAVIAEVFAREPRGDSDTLLILPPVARNPEAWRLQAEVPAELGVRSGDRINLVFPQDHLMFFDKESGMNLMHGGLLS
jgi:ABC-type sugar transport system ATPase subunit